MKIKTLLAAVLVIALFSRASCDKVKDKIKVNVPLTLEFPVIIPAVSTTDTTVVLEHTESENIDELIQEYKESLGSKDIKSVDIESVTLSLDSNSRHFEDDNLQSFKSITAYLSSNTVPVNVEIASLGTPQDPYQIQIPVNNNIDANLIRYFNAQEFTFKLNIKMNRTTEKELTGTTTVKFMIKAGT